MKKEIKNILDDIASSGLPLEIEASSILYKDGWKVRNQVNFIDKETGKERPIDIVASKAFFSKFATYTVLNFTLVIECKRDTKPWLFYTAPVGEIFEHMVMQYACYNCFAFPPIDKELYRLGFNSHYSKLSTERAVIHYEPFKGDAKEKILDAKYKVVKGLEAELERTEKMYKRTRKLVHSRPAIFYFPVIVFDGSLYQLRLENNGLKVQPTEYIKYEFRHAERFYIIDVVTKKYFPEYLKIINDEIDELNSKLK